MIGEALIDVVDDGSRIVEHVGGSPANVALGLGRRGVSVGLLTQVADDLRGRAVLEHLSGSAVHVLPASLSASRTSVAAARIGPDGHAEYDFDVRWDGFESPAGTARIVHTGSIAAFMEPGATAVRQALARTQAEEITFDPNIRPDLVGDRPHTVAAFELLARLATVVKLSDEDASWLYPALSAESAIVTVLELGPRLVVLTLGAEGAILATRTERVRIPAVSIDAVDTIGAGDTFMASLIHSLLDRGSAGLRQEELEAIGQAATRAAALTVSRAGADLPWARELDIV
ncbi:carbohydrate kinase [Microbacterium sp. CFBP9034]|uniref:carbohydrate kinase family protein n=1 Tax=Microbacterium sp. CFBP9034 TaxID=3096540 RepID=UPI002A69CAF1|nr:carbohydrate kinase [Microbacterium sp. CFBP9034]MDY0908825.1 carbohydrate kinase [Microbacterium sp. CFBP9034]